MSSRRRMAMVAEDKARGPDHPLVDPSEADGFPTGGRLCVAGTNPDKELHRHPGRSPWNPASVSGHELDPAGRAERAATGRRTM